MLLLVSALRTPDSTVEFETTAKASLPDALSLAYAMFVLNVGQCVPAISSQSCYSIKTAHISLVATSAVPTTQGGWT